MTAEGEAKGTRTESSGGAGDHPQPSEHGEDQEERSDPAVAERHEEAVRELREGGPSHTRVAADDTTSGG